MEFTHPLKKIDKLNPQEFGKEIEKYARALQELHESQQQEIRLFSQITKIFCHPRIMAKIN
jgi:hypothetical protein